MPNNSLDQLKNLPKEKIAYPLILSIYFFILLLSFALMVNFISKKTNLALEQIEPNQGEQLLTSINLSGYQRIAKKLNFSSDVEALLSPVSENATTSKQTETAPSTTDNLSNTASSSVSDTVVTENLRILIINSTRKSGLASDLKNLLTKNGIAVEKISNQSISENATIIKIRTGLNNSEQVENIKKIVSAKYNFNTLEVPSNSLYDVEIVIGNN